MELNIAGKTALVFGAGGGLGGAIARALAAEGVKVAAADIALQVAKGSMSGHHPDYRERLEAWRHRDRTVRSSASRPPDDTTAEDR